MSIPEAETVNFSLGATTISLAQPTSETSPLQAYLASGGQRPYSFSLRTIQEGSVGSLNLNLTHEARIKLVN